MIFHGLTSLLSGVDSLLAGADLLRFEAPECKIEKYISADHF